MEVSVVSDDANPVVVSSPSYVPPGVVVEPWLRVVPDSAEPEPEPENGADPELPELWTVVEPETPEP